MTTTCRASPPNNAATAPTSARAGRTGEDCTHARTLCRPHPAPSPLGGRTPAQLAQSLATPARSLGEAGAYVSGLSASGLRPPLLSAVCPLPRGIRGSRISSYRQLAHEVDAAIHAHQPLQAVRSH